MSTPTHDTQRSRRSFACRPRMSADEARRLSPSPLPVVVGAVPDFADKLTVTVVEETAVTRAINLGVVDPSVKM